LGEEDDFHAALDLIYGAVLNEQLWPAALIKLADILGTAHIGFCAMDRRAQVWSSIAPRTDPAFAAIYRQTWAFQNPLWTLSAARPAREVFQLDNLVSREEFAATSIYNQWFRPAGFSLAMMAANLHVSDEMSALLAISNKPGDDQITSEQDRIFRAALPHIDRAVRVHRELRIRDLDHAAAPGELEDMRVGLMLVDGAARVLFANKRARALLGNGLTLQGGRLENNIGGQSTLHALIASCAPGASPASGPGGQIMVRRIASRPLRVTVVPLRPRGNVAELPWLGLQIPVAMVMIRGIEESYRG